MEPPRFADLKNEVAFRRLFGTERNKDILIGFLNSVLELKGSKEIAKAQFLPPIQDSSIAYQKQRAISQNIGRQTKQPTSTI